MLETLPGHCSNTFCHSHLGKDISAAWRATLRGSATSVHARLPPTIVRKGWTSQVRPSPTQVLDFGPCAGGLDLLRLAVVVPASDRSPLRTGTVFLVLGPVASSGGDRILCGQEFECDGQGSRGWPSLGWPFQVFSLASWSSPLGSALGCSKGFSSFRTRKFLVFCCWLAQRKVEACNKLFLTTAHVSKLKKQVLKAPWIVLFRAPFSA